MGLLKAFLILILLVSFSGCATTSGKGSAESEEEGSFSATTLSLAGKLRFSDLPVPLGFKLIEDKSFVFQTEDARVALLKYSGRAKIQDLVDFHKEQMLLYNWELLNIVEYGKSILNFQRGSESCIISIEPKGMKKIITISLAPKAKAGIETKTGK
ncbi:MAG: hypothetical protein ISS43_03700 [Candidatus Omnitrophica bacterium]|nr:hypothetical protein [Candidatus Omnitrophota bacterium]